MEPFATTPTTRRQRGLRHHRRDSRMVLCTDLGHISPGGAGGGRMRPAGVRGQPRRGLGAHRPLPPTLKQRVLGAAGAICPTRPGLSWLCWLHKTAPDLLVLAHLSERTTPQPTPWRWWAAPRQAGFEDGDPGGGPRKEPGRVYHLSARESDRRPPYAERSSHLRGKAEGEVLSGGLQGVRKRLGPPPASSPSPSCLRRSCLRTPPRARSTGSGQGGRTLSAQASSQRQSGSPCVVRESCAPVRSWPSSWPIGQSSAKHLVFLIGGSYGLHPSKAAGWLCSMSPMTFPTTWHG